MTTAEQYKIFCLSYDYKKIFKRIYIKSTNRNEEEWVRE